MTRYNPPCNEGDSLTFCAVYSVSFNCGSNCPGGNCPQVMPFLTIRKISEDSVSSCGDCEVIDPVFQSNIESILAGNKIVSSLGYELLLNDLNSTSSFLCNSPTQPRSGLFIEQYTDPSLIKDPGKKSVNNVLITFNMNTCAVNESVVAAPEEQGIPEIIILKYIEGTNVLLSESNPQEFQKLISEAQKKYGCATYPCCVSYTDYQGNCKHTCFQTVAADCNIDSAYNLLSQNEFGITILNTYLSNDKNSCSDVNCSFLTPCPRVLGTCCIPGGDAAGDWGCMVTSKEECSEWRGFWQPPQPDGLGGINPPSCQERGISIEKFIDDGAGGISVVSVPVLLGGRDCRGELGPNPDCNNPYFVGNILTCGDGPDKPDIVGSCCSILPTKNVTNYLVTNATINSVTEKRLYYPESGSPVTINITLSTLNDGSITRISFSDSSVINRLFPVIGGDVEERNSRIENSFSVTSRQSSDVYKAKFVKIENNTIVVTIEKEAQ